MILYHYSPLVHLPPILREGLSKGEVATTDLGKHVEAVSLTTQTDADTLHGWCGADPFKTAVRYACRVADGDPKLEPAADAWKRLGVPPRFLKTLDPRGQRKWWSFYFGAIPHEAFAVELRGRSGYVPVGGDELARVVAEVGAVRDRLMFEVPPGMPWALSVTPRDESDSEAAALMDEAFPADRWLAVTGA